MKNTVLALCAGAFFVPAAWAWDAQWGDFGLNFQGYLTLGAALRLEDRDPSLIGKSNLSPGLCTRTSSTGDANASAGSTSYPGAQGGDIGSTCNGTQEPDLNRRYVEAPGSYNINGDDGNLNFDRGDIVNATAKLQTKIVADWQGFQLYARSALIFDGIYNDFEETSFDTSFQAAQLALPDGAAEQFGFDFVVQDLYVSRDFDVLGRYFVARLGRHRLNWGESTALVLNSINTVNPPDQRSSRIPGFDLAEAFQGVGMFSIEGELMDNLSMEAFYQYEWRPVIIDAPGTFYSSSDILGGVDSDGAYAMLSFGKAPEDPDRLYASQDNSEDPFSLGSAASRTIYRLPDQEPEDGGQYGLSFRYFFENFSNGTEVALYFANYHSRIPSASFRAAQPSCASSARNILELANSCGLLQGDIGGLRLDGEPLPVDTAAVFADYAEDIQMYGISFNTSLGDWAWSGEYSFRPNIPVQIHTVDLTFAALQPAFPENNINLTDLDVLSGTVPVVGDITQPVLDALTNVVATPLFSQLLSGALVLPGRRMAVPDYAQTIYRGQAYETGQPGGYYIQGYERLKMGQFATTLIRTFGASNPLRANQIFLVAEAGFTHVVDMPSLQEIQFQGPEANTHASSGADGSVSAQIPDSAAATGGTETAGNGNAECQRQVFASDIYDAYESEPCRQNPTAQNPANFGDDFAWGVRILSIFKYEDLFWGLNVQPLLGVFYDIKGNAPGLGQNFSEDNFTGIVGVSVDYQQRFSGSVRYTSYEGKTNARRDRDVLAMSVRYDF